jgi:long-chain acyl-CoA synthetase
MSENLASILTDTAEKHGDRIAVKLDDLEVNYAILNEGSKRIAGLLRAKGVEPGERVGIMLPNVPYFPTAYYGILRAGCIVVPMNVLLKGREVQFYLEDSGAKLLFAWHDFADAAETGAGEAGADCILVKPGEFEQLVMDQEPVEELADTAADGSWTCPRRTSSSARCRYSTPSARPAT